MQKLLIMEGNTLKRQRQARALGVRSASDVYIHAIKTHFPDLELDVIHAADRGQALKPGTGYDDYDGLVISGSGLHAYDADFEVTNQIELMNAFAKTGKPILGSCWGLQIAVIASGGSVDLSPKGREVGIARNIILNDAGQAHPLFAGKPVCFDALCIHYDEISTLPANATLLCTNAHSAVQGAIVPLGRSEVWAVQYHPEYDLEQISMMISLFEKDMISEGFFADNADFKSYISTVNRLIHNPKNKALAWRLGVDDNILNDELRNAEIINWIKTCVLK